ncbi:MAG: hypothetical protein ABIS86_22035 [Streptosporangiaceae bacterium]
MASNLGTKFEISLLSAVTASFVLLASACGVLSDVGPGCSKRAAEVASELKDAVIPNLGEGSVATAEVIDQCSDGGDDAYLRVSLTPGTKVPQAVLDLSKEGWERPSSKDVPDLVDEYEDVLLAKDSSNGDRIVILKDHMPGDASFLVQITKKG